MGTSALVRRRAYNGGGRRVATGPAGRHDEEACRIAFGLTLNSLRGTESIQRTASDRLPLLRDLAKSRSG